MVFCLKKIQQKTENQNQISGRKKGQRLRFCFRRGKKVDVAFLHMSFFVGKRVHVHTGAIVQRVARAGERMDVRVTVSGRVRVAMGL